MNKLLKGLIFSVLILVLTAAALTEYAEALVTWHTETADTGRQYTGEFGYDADGNPGFVQIDYYNALSTGNNGYAFYRHKTALGWVSEAIGPATGLFPKLAFDSGRPSVLYNEPSDSLDKLIYAERNPDGSWTKTTIAEYAYGMDATSLKFDSDGYPCVTYSINSTLYYATDNGKGWKNQVVFNGGEIYYADLAFNGTTPAIAFCAGRWGGGLQYAFLQGSTWNVQTVDSVYSGTFRNRQTTITLRFGNGKPLITYNDEDTRSLKFAYPADQSWQIRTVESSSGSRNYTGDFASMQVAQHERSCTIYILHSNYTVNQTTSIRLKTLTVNSDGDLAKAFTSQTLYSKNFGNMSPMTASSLKDGNPSVVFLDFHASKTTYISMQPDIQAVTSVAFGAVTPEHTERRDITITNNGSVNLSISEIGAPADPFAVTGGDFTVLPPGGTGTVTVSFTPPAAGEAYQGTLTIRSNDPDEAVFNIALSGRSIGSSAELSGMSFNNGASLTMQPGVTGYNLEVAHATDTLRVKPAAAHAYATITVNSTTVPNGTFSGAIPLKVGLNTVTVEVTPENRGPSKLYTLNVTRRDSPDATLSGLTVSDGELSPTFSPEIHSYTITLPDGISDLSVIPAASQPKSTVSINGSPVAGGASHDLFPSVGSNKYTVHVLAPDGKSSMDYSVTVLRKPELSGISLNDGVLNFTPFTTSYETVVPNSVSALTVTPTATGECSVSVNGIAMGSGTASDPVDLKVGDNTIIVKVLSADEETFREYTLSVTRLEGLYALSVGDTQVMLPTDQYNLSVEITDAACPLFFGVPSGLSVKVGGALVTDGISQTFEFNEGLNAPIEIKLISPDCEESVTYTLTITRRPLLTNLVIGGSAVALWGDETVYVWAVANASATAMISASANEGTIVTMDERVNYPVTISNGNWIIQNLRVGANPIYLLVKSQDGQAETMYTILLQRLPALSGLSVSEGTPSLEFYVDTFHYTVNVKKDIDSIMLCAVLQTDGSTGYEIGSLTINGDTASSGVLTPIALAYGCNVIPVVVTTDSHVNAVYNVNVIRQEPEAGSITPTSASFDKYVSSAGYQDINITVTAASPENPLLALKNSGSTLTADIDYTVSGSIYTIKKEYLTTLPAGSVQLTFDFAYGPDPALTVNVSDSAPHIGGGSSTPPAYDANVSDGRNIPVTVNTNTGAASVNMGLVSDSIVDGIDMVVEIPPISSVNSYLVNLPSSAISGDGAGTLTLNTHLGSITLPGNMLSGSGHAGEATISIGAGDISALPDDVKAAIGNKPLISLSLSVDGTQTEWSNPSAPVTVSIPYTPTTAELQTPESIVIWYIDGSGKAVCIPNGHYDPATGTVTFTTTHFSDYAVVYNQVSFSDVGAGAWYSHPVAFIAARGITAGTGDGNFSPVKALTRGEFIVMLMRAYGLAPDSNPADNFADAGNTYYTDYLAAVKRLGISAGIGGNLFAPDKEITRQEMFTLLYNTLKSLGQLPEADSGKQLSDFNDAGQVDTWAKEAMTLLVETGIVGGSAGNLTPRNITTRAEFAQIMYKLLTLSD